MPRCKQKEKEVGGRWEAFSKGSAQLMDPMDLSHIDMRLFLVQPSYLSDLGTGTRSRLALRLGLFPPLVNREFPVDRRSTGQLRSVWLCLW